MGQDLFCSLMFGEIDYVIIFIKNGCQFSFAVGWLELQAVKFNGTAVTETFRKNYFLINIVGMFSIC